MGWWRFRLLATARSVDFSRGLQKKEISARMGKVGWLGPWCKAGALRGERWLQEAMPVIGKALWRTRKVILLLVNVKNTKLEVDYLVL